MALYVLGYVYQISDFDTSGSNIAPPNEQGAQAAGSPPFTMTLLSTAVPLRILIDDADVTFHETGGTDTLQELAEPVTIDGVLYPTGSHVILNYRLTDDDGYEGFSITIGATNTGGNTTTAFITNQDMVPGQTYVFTSESNIGNNDTEPYAQFACFTAGTLIETADGPKRIETLVAGDMVLTADDGAQPVRWVGQCTVLGVGAMAPITIHKGTFGASHPLTVSPNHRILVEGAVAQLVTGHDSILVAAKRLVNGHSVTQDPRGFVTYVHVMFDRHQIITAYSCKSESYFLSDQSNDVLEAETMAELLELFPDLAGQGPAKLVCAEAKAYEAALICQALAA